MQGAIYFLGGMIVKKNKSEELITPKIIKQGWDILVTGRKGKKITGIVRNIICQKNGDWKFDIHRKSDDEFMLTLEWKE